MALAMEVWSHMTAQGVQPSPEEYVHMITGWAAAGELRRRVADGVVEEFLRQLAGMAFELEPMHCCDEAATASATPSSRDELSGKGRKGARTIITPLCVSPSVPLSLGSIFDLLLAIKIFPQQKGCQIPHRRGRRRWNGLVESCPRACRLVWTTLLVAEILGLENRHQNKVP